MPTVIQRIEWDAGHRLMNHNGKCRHLHGHRYAAEFYVQAEDLDDQGMVVDFGRIKDVIKRWIDTYLDHKMILQRGDIVADYLKIEQGLESLFMMEEPPTAENIAKGLFMRFRELENCFGDTQAKVIAVRVWETPNCSAVFTEDDAPFTG